MKHQLLKSVAIIIAFVSSLNVSAQDAWILSARDGFDNINNTTVYGMNVFGGKLYAGVGSDSGYVYSSTTGNINSWTKVFSPGSRSIDAITSTPIGGGNMYVASNNDMYDSCRVFRSTDGTSWTPFFASPTRITFIIPFKGAGADDSIYVVNKNDNGDRILKTYYNSMDYWNTSSQWDTVLNFEQSNPFTLITAIGKHNSKLFIGTSTAELWSSADGNNWVINANVGSGFGDPDNKGITAITSFMGKIYVGTENNVDGAQLWSSSDEITWTLVHQFPYENEQVSSLTIADGKLWITVKGYSDGIVANSSDGTSIVISNDNSFGNSDNNGRYASITEFGNNIYWAGEHDYFGGKGREFSMSGAQIWRLCTVTPPTVNIGPDQTVCPGVPVLLDAGVGASAYVWQNMATTQTTTVTAPGYWSVEYIGSNGCSAYDTILINALASPSVNITTPVTFAGMPYTVCSGVNTNMQATAVSNAYTPDPPIHIVANDTIADVLPPVNDTIVVSGITPTCACDALMSVTIDSSYHTYAGDLVIRIYAPDGSNVLLSQQRGGSADNSYFGTEFRMNGLDGIAFASPPFTGVYQPEESFSALTGNPNGAWSLNIQDIAGGDEGNLKGWTIRFKVDDTVMTYSWAPPVGLSSVNTLATIASPTVTTTYTLTTTNTIGCSTEQTIMYDVPAISLPQSADTVCYGGSLMLNVAGATASAVWSPAGGLDVATGPNVIASPSVSTTYYVNDSISGCAVSDSIHLHANGQLFLNSPAPVTICYSDTATLTANASGGSGPYVYTWDMGGSYLYGETINTSPVSGTSFTISATDAAGCFIGGGSTSISVMPSTDVYGHVSYTGGNVTGSSVVLYEYVPFLTHFDTIQTTMTDASGNYYFPSVDHSNYLIEVFPNATYTTLVPTYYGNVFLWDSAIVVSHDCYMADTFNIVTVEEMVVTGPGLLQGTIVEDDGFGRAPGDPIPGVDVKLGRNPGGQLVTSTQTNGSGTYTFANLPYDDYVVYVDITGLGSDSTYNVTVDAANPTYLNLDYEVDSTEITPVQNSATGVTPNTVPAKMNAFSVYPNPSNGIATIEYTVTEDASVSLGIYNVLGIKMIDIMNTKQIPGTYRYSINNEKDKTLTSGVYFVTLIINEKTNIHRLIINK
jgi:subtilisin-like proprotein convertase family protein